MDGNKAKERLWPSDTKILVRFIWLYVGQGSSTVILAKDGDRYKTLLVDINLDSANGGVNVPLLMADLLENGSLDVFINTHPHDDHLCGITELWDKVKIDAVWHSGHKPGRKHNDAYKDLMKVVDKVNKAGGVETKLRGSKEEQLIGDVSYYIIAPAEYVVDDVNDEDPEVRYKRIHEQCAVLKVGTNQTWGLLPGDADRDAFEKHITTYHKERLGSVVMAAPHHGSRTFFHYDEDDVPYLDALDEIGPKYIVVSAPKSGESKHDHPHEDAMSSYAEKVGRENIYHTGQDRCCYIFDIYQDGTTSEIQDDQGAIANAYPLNGGDDGNKSPSFTKREKVTNITGNRYA